MEVAEDNLNEAKAAEEAVKRKIALNESQQSLAKSNNVLANEYENLGKKAKRSDEEQTRFIELHNKLSKSYTGVLGPIEDYNDNQEALRKAMGRTNVETDKSTAANIKLIKR